MDTNTLQQEEHPTKVASNSRIARRWNPRYEKILTMHIKGRKNYEIAKDIGLTPTSVSSIVSSDEFKKRKQALSMKVIDRVHEGFGEYAMTAVQKIIEIAESGKPDQRVQLDAAKEILYQIGCKPKEVVETITRQYTIEEVQSARKTISEVEEIMNRLGGAKSKFVLTSKQSEYSSETSTPDVGNTISASPAGPETLPT